MASGLFEILNQAAREKRLILIDGGLCYYHLRRDGQLTIHFIIATKKNAREKIFCELKKVKKAQFLLAKCPADKDSANDWFKGLGFELIRTERTRTRSGRRLNVWSYIIQEPDLLRRSKPKKRRKTNG